MIKKIISLIVSCLVLVLGNAAYGSIPKLRNLE